MRGDALGKSSQLRCCKITVSATAASTLTNMPAAGSSKQALDREEEALWEAEEDRFSDWEEEVDAQAQSLFDASAIFPRVSEALAYDRTHFNFDLLAVAKKLQIDGFGCIRFVNYLRSTKPSAQDALAIQDASAFQDEAYFKPVIEDDAYLQLDFDDLLEEVEDSKPVAKVNDPTEIELERLREAYENLLTAYQKRIEEEDASGSDSDSGSDAPPRRRVANKTKKPDHDSHYFQSYSENE